MSAQSAECASGEIEAVHWKEYGRKQGRAPGRLCAPSFGIMFSDAVYHPASARVQRGSLDSIACLQLPCSNDGRACWLLRAGCCCQLEKGIPSGERETRVRQESRVEERESNQFDGTVEVTAVVRRRCV